MASVIDVSRVAFYLTFAAGMLLALAGCVRADKAIPQPSVTVVGCEALPRLQASRQDTKGTREAISAYIDKWDALCAPTNGAKP